MRIVSLPGAPTGADVSFFSTLGCSLRGALTSGSMALALLSPFIWSERALAPVPPSAAGPAFTWPPLSFPELPWQLAATTSSRQTTSPWAPRPCTPSANTHTRLCGERLWCIWILTPCTHTFFFSSPPQPPLHHRFSTLLYQSVSACSPLSVWVFSASHSGLWSERGADHLFGGKTAVGRRRFNSSHHQHVAASTVSQH